MSVLDNSTVSQSTAGKFKDFRDIAEFVLGILCVLLIPCICFGNFLVIISLVKFRRLRTITYTLVGSLSVADSLLAVLTLPIYSMFYFKLTFTQSVKYLCLFKFSSVCASMTASMINLVAIGFDRYVAILHPLKYKAIMTHKRVRIFIACMWIYIIPVCVLPLVWNTYDEIQICDYFKILPLGYTIYAAFISIAISLVLSLYLYIRIYLVARQQQKQVRKDSLRGHHSLDPQMEKDTKSAKVMALVLFLFYVFWVPFTITGPIKYSVNIDNDLAETLKNITLFLAMTNSMINPIIYCWLRREFREAFRSICVDSCCFHSDKNVKESFGNSLLFNSISTEQHRDDVKPPVAL